MPWPIRTDSNGMPVIDLALARRIEGIEIEAVTAIDDGNGANSTNNGPASYKRYGRATAYFAPSTDVLALNRIIGLGLWDEVDDETIELLLNDVRAGGVTRFFVQVNPFARPDNLADMLQAKGLTFRNNWVKLIRNAEPLRDVTCPFEIREIGEELARAPGEICVTCFDWPGWMADELAAAVGGTRWRFYCAFEGSRPIATGGLYFGGDTGYISMAATLPEYRGKGAQQAIAVRRINDAIAQGCRLFTVETADDTPDHPSPSYRNMLKLGFVVAYRRANYLWER